MRILVLKPECNDFESFISESIRAEGVSAFAPFDERKLQRSKFLFLLAEHLHAWSIYRFFLNDWAISIRESDLVIVFDYGLRRSLLEWIKHANPKAKVIVWLWNVFDEYPMDKLKAADYVFTFDESFSAKHGFLHAPQFHFPRVIQERLGKASASFDRVDISFVGYDKGRKDQLLEISSVLDGRGLTYCFTLIDPNGLQQTYPGMYGSTEILQEMVPYSSVLDRVCKSNAVLDLCKDGQTGLTLRVLEALYGRKKLITDNCSIMNSDLYDENNIFVIGKDDWEKLGEFLESPYHVLSEELEADYSFSGWVETITNSLRYSCI